VSCRRWQAAGHRGLQLSEEGRRRRLGSVDELFLGKTSCYSFIQFFSQKLCIGIALIDTFLSIAAHLWSPPYSYPITFLWGGGGGVPKGGGGFSGLKTKPVQTSILSNYLINQSEWMRWITCRRGHLAIIYHFSMCTEHDKMSFRSIFDKTNEVFQFFLPFDK
jgi:hypothetical protein